MLLAILTAAMRADAAQTCRDKQLEVACKTAIEAADELIRQKDAKVIYLESQLKIQLSQNEAAQKLIVDLSNKSWYTDPINVFLIGLVTGIITSQGVSK